LKEIRLEYLICLMMMMMLMMRIIVAVTKREGYTIKPNIS